MNTASGNRAGSCNIVCVGGSIIDGNATTSKGNTSMPIPIEISAEQRKDAIASLRQYFDQNLPEPIGDLPASLLVDFVLEEIGPAIYNKGVSDASSRLQLRAADLPGELYADEFQYWPRLAAKRAGRPGSRR